MSLLGTSRGRRGCIAAGCIAAGCSLLVSVVGPEASAGEASSRRQREIVEGIVRYAPWDCPDRWLYELGAVETRNRVLHRAMVEATSWVEFLALANALDWSGPEAARTADALLERLPALARGKARQNIVFLVALTAPDAAERLEPLWRGAVREATGADRMDAACALAALGHAEAQEWLEANLPTSEEFLTRPIFDWAGYLAAERDEARRAAIRSYRLWEVIFRRSYYRPLQFLARASLYTRTAGLRDALRADEIAARLLPVFIARWHGHPGSDDVALRMMNFAIQKRDRRSIYRWAQRASLLPDQDCAEGAVHVFTSLADSQLSVEDLDAILASADGRQNRDFLRYERYLQTVRADLAEGIEYFDAIAREEAGSVFACARQRAASVAPTGALRDGLDDSLSLEILRGYPGRSVLLARTPWKPAEEVSEDAYLGLLNRREREVVLRTRLHRSSSVSLDPDALARQYRLHVELLHLRRMEEAEESADRRADLRYRRAKLYYRESRVLYPLWEGEIMNAGYRWNSVRYDREADRRLEEHVAATFALRRAFTLLDSIRRDYPAYRGMDLVLFHMGHCWAKLMDYRPAKAVDAWVFPDRPPAGSKEERVEFAHRRTGEIFRSLIRGFSESPWAQQVERATEYHFKMARLLKARREKEARGTEGPSSGETPPAKTSPWVETRAVEL